ncbi:class I SAM-dependent methyltransferase [Acidobacteriota bacterium]
MRKQLFVVLFVYLYVAPSMSLTWVNQDHKHINESRSHYEERLERHKDRWYWQMPRRVMNELMIGPGMSVADVGAGIGYFTLRLSERVGETGKVYASDIDQGGLDFLDERRKEANLENIHIIHGKENDPMIPDVSVDLVMIVNTIQFVKEKTEFLDNIRKSLKQNGRLVFVQWNAEKMDSELPGWGKDDRELYTLHTMLRMIYEADYEVLEIKDFLPMQLIYVCQPSDTSK